MAEANPITPCDGTDNASDLEKGDTLENAEKAGNETKSEKEQEREIHVCTIHTEELCRYCRDCEQTLCLSCLELTDDHTGHWVQTLEEVEPWARQELRYHMDALRKKRDEVMVIQQTLIERQEELERRRQEELDSVDRQVEYVTTLVREAGEEAKKQYKQKIIMQHLFGHQEDDSQEPDLD